MLYGRRNLNSECRRVNIFINIQFKISLCLSKLYTVDCFVYRIDLKCLTIIFINCRIINCDYISGEYLQTQCLQNAVNCTPCPERLPSCIGLPDGNNPFPTRPNSQYYVKCFQNRTVAVEVCQVSLFEPSTRECSNVIDASMYRTYKLYRVFLGFCICKL